MEPTRPRAPEFSRFVQADSVGDRGIVREIEATEAERAALARRLGLEEIGLLRATLRLARIRGGQMVRVEGTIRAEVVQTSVVSLEPVPNTVEEAFAALFAPPELVPETGLELDIDPEEDDPEPFENGRIDLGELTAQHLSLALDPYPRLPGEEAPAVDESPLEEGPEPPAEGETRQPFAALARLRDRR